MDVGGIKSQKVQCDTHCHSDPRILASALTEPTFGKEAAGEESKCEMLRVNSVKSLILHWIKIRRRNCELEY
ncbi:MAG TPA: hypothetical protein ENH85_14970 [Candidatus Scalindua sp.]|nr:hypothetical protein [Candidatus Scalindua sp.]